jgi:hypothetical protein
LATFLVDRIANMAAFTRNAIALLETNLAE